MAETNAHFDIVVVGSGPAGMTAAIYAAPPPILRGGQAGGVNRRESAKCQGISVSRGGGINDLG